MTEQAFGKIAMLTVLVFLAFSISAWFILAAVAS